MTAPTTDEPVLDVAGLTVRLPADADRDHAVEDVSFTVRRKQVLCVVGESGSGKSVSAQAVMGLLPAGQLTVTEGGIRLLGEDLRAATPARLRDLRGSKMAMIFQEPMTALNPVMTVGRQIDEVLAIHTDLSRRARRDRVRDLMDSVHLPDPDRLGGAYPHQLSGGQRQRVMIAMALALEPALLIADEPTTALDVTTQAQILKLIREIQSAHDTGVLFITHDFGVVADIADHVAVMQAGRIVETGPVAEVLGTPRHDYTRMLVRAVPSLTPPERPQTAQGPVALATRELVKTYTGGGLFQKRRTVDAVRGVDLQVRRGETLGIVGESGSGKSTVARCIVRLVDPTSGSVTLGDTEIATLGAAQLRRHRREIQIVFQDPYRSLNPRRMIGSSITEGPVNFGMDAAQARTRARELMGLVGLEPDALDRYPHQFSGGQRQRICIARALAMEPTVLIADEAVSALDVSVQAQVLDLLADIRDRFELALLFITHDLRVAAQLCDRIAVMHQGAVVESGATAAVFASPRHDYTRRLLDSAPGRTWRFGEPGGGGPKMSSTLQ